MKVRESRAIDWLLLALLLAILLALGAASSLPAHGADALQCVNSRRAMIGLPPLVHDPQLFVLAERESLLQAQRGRMGHILGAPRPARAAGVGMQSRSDPQGRYFQSCYAASRSYQYAGASVVVGRDGRTYYTLMLR